MAIIEGVPRFDNPSGGLDCVLPPFPCSGRQLPLVVMADCLWFSRLDPQRPDDHQQVPI